MRTGPHIGPWSAALLEKGGIGNGAGPYVVDNFTDSDSTNLTAHTPDTDVEGGGWIQYSAAAIEVQLNKAAAIGGIQDRFYGINAGIADEVSVEGTLQTPGGSSRNVSLVLSLSDGDNSIYGELDQFGDLKIVERIAGVNTTKASGAVAGFVAGTDYAATLTRSGANIAFTVDGNLISWSGAPASPTETDHGIMMSRGNTPTIDDFIITDKP